MLGSVGTLSTWQWAARGKHPVAKDYFEVGSKNPMVEAFSAWLEKGYRILGSRKQPSAEFCSWRFWARGPRRETLVCGVGRDSCDSVGRPFPLLIIGTGPLADWRDKWDLLPFACEKTWSRMEYLSTKRFTDFRQFEDEVQIIKPPVPHWSEFVSERQDLGGLDRRELENKVASLSQETDFFVSLDGGPSDDPYTLASLWHALLKVRMSEVPTAIFMGGAANGTHLAVVKRALAPTDFVRLWSRGKELEVLAEDAGGAVGGHRLD